VIEFLKQYDINKYKMSICANLTCVTTNCNGYSVNGCMPLPLDSNNERCFTSQYCNQFTGCTLINELYSQYVTNYTCYNTTTPKLPNNSTILAPKLFIFILILWILPIIMF
jgi:hypothetical protein